MCSELDQATYYKDDLVRQESRSSVYFMFISFFIFSFFLLISALPLLAELTAGNPREFQMLFYLRIYTKPEETTDVHWREIKKLGKRLLWRC